MRKRVPDGPRHSNCLFWAWHRTWTRGGYFMFRKSRHSRWKFHVVWTANGRFWWGYAPQRPVRSAIALIHGLRFRGHLERERAPKFRPRSPRRGAVHHPRQEDQNHAPSRQ